MTSLPDFLQEQAYQYRLAKLKKEIPAAKWIEDNFYLYDTRNLITLEDCQRRPLELALSKDENGNYKYLTILWAWPKKSAKSSVIAAVADYRAEHTTNGSIRLTANDAKQAESRVGYYLRESIHIGQMHGRRQGIQTTPSGYKMVYPNGARVECIPVDPSGEAGGNDDMIVYSELWAWKSKAHQRMWSEMTLSPNRFGKAQRWIDTYAGIRGQSPILEPLYEVGVKNGVQVWPDLEVYANDAARMLTVWVTKPMFSWQTEDYYASEAAQLIPSEFDRMHRNQWAESTEAFIPIQWWDACKIDTFEDMRPHQGVILGIDAAVDSDWFAIVAITVTNGKYQLRYCRVWKPSKNEKIKLQEPADEVLRLSKIWNIECIAYDPMHMEYMAQQLGDNIFWYRVEQGKHRLICDKYLYDVIREQQIEHDGSFPEMRQAIINADKKPEDDKLRIIKRTANEHIDPLIAMSMAVERASTYNI